jgi:hydrogenase maturation protease
MTVIRIIGIGSPSGDDRIGLDAIDALQASGLLGRYPAGSVEACRCDRPAALLAMLQGIDAAILIDALQSGALPGTLHRLEAHQLAPAAGATSSHGMGVADSLALGQALGMLPPSLHLYGIEGRCAAPASDPGSAVRGAIASVLGAIAADLAAALGPAPVHGSP